MRPAARQGGAKAGVSLRPGKYCSHRAASVRRVDQSADTRGNFKKIVVNVLLVLQAAHQPAAGAADFNGVKRKPLFLCHFNGYRLKIAQKLRAAKRFAANAQSAEHLRFVADADLPQLDTGTENGSQILDQRAEIDAPVRSKVKQNFVVVKRVFHVDELHFHLMLGNLFFADRKRFLFAAGVVLHPGQVGSGCLACDRLERENDLVLRNVAIAHGDKAAFHTACGLHNSVIALFQPDPGRVEIIYLSCVLKPDADYFCHESLLNRWVCC